MLRPALYNALRARADIFGKVAVHLPGFSFESYILQLGTQKKEVVTRKGEAYAVNCPYCTDRRGRLVINHMFGTTNALGQRRYWLCKCWNEDCVNDFDRRLDLYNKIFEQAGMSLVGEIDKVLPAYQSVDHQPTALPKFCQPVHELPQGHAAVNYLETRGFDVRTLGTVLGVSYCYDRDPACPVAFGRIVVPVVQNGMQVGWQARYLGNPPTKRIPKYYTRGPKSTWLYNFDFASNYSHVVVCEGVTDVWKVGPEAVCLFGKIASSHQLQLLKRWGTIVVLLDSDATPAINSLVSQLSDRHVVAVSLPKGLDPGAMQTDVLRSIIFSQLQKSR